MALNVPSDVDGEDAVQLSWLHVLEAHIGENPRVAHEDVETAEVLDRSCDGVVDLGEVADVGSEAHRVAARGVETLRGRLGAGEVAVDEGNLTACVGETISAGEPEPLGGARDEGDPPIEASEFSEGSLRVLGHWL